MADERRSVISRRDSRLAKKLRKKEYRDAYLNAHVRQFLAHQMRAFRGGMKQTEFGQSIGQSQSVVSERLENPAYGKWTLQTLFELASKLDVALVCQFVDYPTFLKFSGDLSPEMVKPAAFDGDALEQEASNVEEILENIRSEENWSRPPQEKSKERGAQSAAEVASEQNIRSTLKRDDYLDEAMSKLLAEAPPSSRKPETLGSGGRGRWN